jgi:phage gp29-like protein
MKILFKGNNKKPKDKELKALQHRVKTLEHQVSDYAENKKKEVKPPAFGVVDGVIDKDHITAELNENLGEGQDKVDKAAEMERIDPKLKGYINTRVLALTGLKREISGDDEVSDFVRQVFSGFNNFSDTLNQKLRDALRLGSSFPELIWGEKDGKVIIERIEIRSPGKFKFGEKNELLMTGDKDTIPVDERRIVPFTFQSEHGNRYGKGLYNEIYWNNYIKKHVKEFWCLGIETFNNPKLIGEDPGIDKDFSEALDKFIANLKYSSGLRVPVGAVLKYLEARGTAGESEEKLISVMDAENAIAILGQTLTSDVGKVGSYAAAMIHNLVRKDILMSDISMEESYINDLWIKPLVDFNFANVDKYPKWRIVQNDTVDNQAMIQVIEGLLRSGFKTIPVAWIHQLFGIPIPGEGEETLHPTAQLMDPGNTVNFSEWQSKQYKDYMEQLRKLHG